ncbi:YusU family protein [Rossellomorea vietnamensis]|uniref:YusU family protein n=1 Tax=Rossellomorea vietnamensis TaxID=218284 RepID=A0ACD4C7Q5_9BACI|nr:YusU family protein [Rossellomorea vietnamensis]UXH43617.1 YusU family protein [Rossellomorea vietnamensis]
MKEFPEQFDALLEKYTELLVGETDATKKEMVTQYALYSFIAKNMPALVKHWNSLYPEGKDEMKRIVGEIKEMNEAHRAEMSRKKTDE